MIDPPRLAVIGDIAVERLGGGSLLLYRLLKDYPADRLIAIHNPVMSPGIADLRIPGVPYRDFRYRIPRLIKNRLNPFWSVVAGRLISRQAGAILEYVRDFAPEAILTVPHGYLWFAAAEIARRLDVPLHLILHDDWASLQTGNRAGRLWDAVRWAGRRDMGRVYRQAASRMCVSPGMVEQYQEWFGAGGTVLYPSRGEDSAPIRVRVRAGAGGPPVVAFSGMIHQAGVLEQLRRMAGILAEMGGHLDFYTVLTAEWLAERGLGPPTVRVAGFLPADEMSERIGRTAHALFLPSSFEPRERVDVSTLFPSKLADYTAIGLPVIAWGPPYSSAARWSADNPGAVMLFTSPEPAPVREALRRLVADPDHATRIAEAGIDAGRECFELERAKETVFRMLQNGRRAKHRV